MPTKVYNTIIASGCSFFWSSAFQMTVSSSGSILKKMFEVVFFAFSVSVCLDDFGQSRVRVLTPLHGFLSKGRLHFSSSTANTFAYAMPNKSYTFLIFSPFICFLNKTFHFYHNIFQFNHWNARFSIYVFVATIFANSLT